MTIRLLPLAFLSALLVAGCGKNETTTASTAAPSTPAATGTPAATAATPAASAAKATAVRTIEITANDQMKFSVATIEAKAGEELKVVLENVGMLPKQAMGHNWVLLKAGTDVAAFGAASATAAATDYIPPALKDQVIASIHVLGPKEKGDVTFKAPAPGEYPFICSFPGHFALMKGTLTVK
jgi:azurin